MYRLIASTGFGELINQAIPRYTKRGRSDQWLLEADIQTPGGLPLQFWVSIGVKDRIEVSSGDAVLLTYHMTGPDYAGFELLLPTDEKLHVWIDTERSSR